MVLTDENFDTVIERNRFIMVMFYAPWCLHCKALSPKYQAVGKQLVKEKHDPPIALGKIDAEANKKMGDRYKIEGYPTLKLFVKGKDEAYKGK